LNAARVDAYARSIAAEILFSLLNWHGYVHRLIYHPTMSSLDLNNTFGALLLGTIISSILYGFTCVQSWHYFQNYSDGPLVKVSVAALWILESLHSAFSIHAIYYYVILNYMNPGALVKATWSAAVGPSVALQMSTYR
jgi:hypothetical protein